MKYLRRLFSYVALRLVAITLCLALLVCAFYMAFNIGGAYVMITEGMEKRCMALLTLEDVAGLNEYFTAFLLENDQLLNYALEARRQEDYDAWPYLKYTITDLDYSVEISDLRTWPWVNQVDCVVTEHISGITGKVKTAFAASASSNVPSMEDKRYRVSLIRQENGWRIQAIYQDNTYRDTKGTAT